jgi:hypothetical protein
VESLFAAARLADEQRLKVDAQLLGPAGVEGMLGVDERGDAARLLGLGDDVQRAGRLAAGFRAEDLDDAALGDRASAADFLREWPPVPALSGPLRGALSLSFLAIAVLEEADLGAPFFAATAAATMIRPFFVS